MDNSLMGPMSFAITQGFMMFSTFTPPLFEVRRANLDNDPEFAADVRMGEASATALVIGAGGFLSFLAGSYHPLFAAILTSGVLVMVYETALRGRPFSRGGLHVV